MIRLNDSLITGFIDRNKNSSEEYQPRLLVNDNLTERKFLNQIIHELKMCDEFYFSVAFITNSGIAALFNSLRELEERGIKGKIVTSQYLNFTEPKALERLLKFSNLEVRIVTEENLHAKGYIFKKNDKYTIIIGSSNWTQNALSVNKEWNLKISSMNNGVIVHNTLEEFNKMYDNASMVTQEWIDEYKKLYQAAKLSRMVKNDQDNNLMNSELRKIQPNKMQKEALLNLNKLRSEGKNKALLVSATGTGKTYLSAFDARNHQPKRLLFVVHRETILKAAIKTYRNIFGSEKTMGLLSGNSKETNVDFVFSTVQTLSKEKNLSSFAPNHFDYIVIDEVHHSTSNTYQRIIEYFKPKFFLGMSATPERMDGCNVFEIFDYNIAYEIRLKRALEENMLIPFHYYGISDIEINGEILSDKAAFRNLVSNERVEKIISASQLYGCDHGRIKGLIFCSKVEEAETLSLEFNRLGYKTIALSGSDNEGKRDEAIKKLEENNLEEVTLDYIFTVDIFNEGVDIPSINQIIMLRPTQSATVFVQQLGRGLRKSSDKEYLTVIDFIGNYANNYLVPIALYGDNSYNKDNIRKLISGGSAAIPGASTINFDTISKQRIFDAIDGENISQKKYLKKDYELLKFKLGKVPTMMDFVYHGSRDPYTYVEYAGSYFKFIIEFENEIKSQLSGKEQKLLEFFSKEVCNGRRIEEVVLMIGLISKGKLTLREFLNSMKEKFQYEPSEATIKSVISYLNGNFITKVSFDKYEIKENIVLRNDTFFLSDYMKELITNNSDFLYYLIDMLNYAYHRFSQFFAFDKYKDGFKLYEKYSRKDVCRILNWEKNEEAVIMGYKIKYNTCPIFVNYKKEENIDVSTKYEDCFINRYQFSWMTRSQKDLNSSDVISIKNYNSELRISLFIKKSNNEGNDFYYMGDLEPIDCIATTIENNSGQSLPIVNIIYNLKNPVEENIYDYITK